MPTKRIIQLHNVNNDKDCVRKVKELGNAVVKNDPHFQRTVTHLVCGDLMQSEKFLAACVSGCYVVTSAYVDDSHTVGHWLEEQDYAPTVQHHPHDLVDTYKRWHWRVTTFGEKPFSGWQVALLLAPERLQQWRRVLLFGDAKIVHMPMPLKQRAVPQVTYVVMDSTSQQHAEELQQFGLLCISYEYIRDFLIMPPPDNSMDCELDVFDYILTSRNSQASHSETATEESADVTLASQLSETGSVVLPSSQPDLSLSGLSVASDVSATQSRVKRIRFVAIKMLEPLEEIVDAVQKPAAKIMSSQDSSNSQEKLSSSQNQIAVEKPQRAPISNIDPNVPVDLQQKRKFRRYGHNDLNIAKESDRPLKRFKPTPVIPASNVLRVCNNDDTVKNDLMKKSSHSFRNVKRALFETANLTAGRDVEENSCTSSDTENSLEAPRLSQSRDNSAKSSQVTTMSSSQPSAITPSTTSTLTSLTSKVSSMTSKVTSSIASDVTSAVTSSTTSAMTSLTSEVRSVTSAVNSSTTSTVNSLTSELKSVTSAVTSVAPSRHVSHAVTLIVDSDVDDDVEILAETPSRKRKLAAFQTKSSLDCCIKLLAEKSLDSPSKPANVAEVEVSPPGQCASKFVLTSAAKQNLKLVVNKALQTRPERKKSQDGKQSTLQTEKLKSVISKALVSASSSWSSLSQTPAFQLSPSKPDKASGMISPSVSKASLKITPSSKKKVKLIKGQGSLHQFFQKKKEVKKESETPKKTAIPSQAQPSLTPPSKSTTVPLSKAVVIIDSDDEVEYSPSPQVVSSQLSDKSTDSQPKCSTPYSITKPSFEQKLKHAKTKDSESITDYSVHQHDSHTEQTPKCVVNQTSENEMRSRLNNLIDSYKFTSLTSTHCPRCPFSNLSDDLPTSVKSCDDLFDSSPTSCSCPASRITLHGLVSPPAVCLNSDQACKPALPLLEQFIEAARDMEYEDIALMHSQTCHEYLPTPGLINEILKLACSSESHIHSRTITHLQIWLEKHPPMDEALEEVYCQGVSLDTQDSFFSRTISYFLHSTGGDNFNPHVGILKYLVSVLAINFNHCLQSGKRKRLQSCLIVRAVWGHSHAVCYNAAVRDILAALKNLLESSPPFSCGSLKPLLSLVSMVTHCLHLAGVGWNLQSNPSLADDNILSLAQELGRILTEIWPGSDGAEYVTSVISCLDLAWLRVSVLLTILSTYNDYLLTDSLRLGSVSLTSIVFQYFFLMPPLQGTRVPDDSMDICQDPVSKQFEFLEKTGYPSNLTADKVNKRNWKGETLLHAAAMRGDVQKMMQYLSVPGVDVNMTDHAGWSPLHEACNHGSLECVELLLKYVPPAQTLKTQAELTNQNNLVTNKVDINAKGPGDRTPLHDAVINGQMDICKLLLKYGGSKILHVKNEDGYTPIDVATDPNFRDVLLSHVSSLHNDERSSGKPPIDFLYSQLLGSRSSLYVDAVDMSAFLALLSQLISSYGEWKHFYCQHECQNHCSGGRASQGDVAILSNMGQHTKMFVKHLARITTPHDFCDLEFDISLFISLCLNMTQTLT